MILVTGATGNVGRHVVGGLLGAGRPVRALTRDPGRAGLPAGAEVLRGDLSEPETLPPALEGAEAVFLFAVPGTASAFLDAALKADVGRIVLLSSLAVDDAAEVQPNAIGAYHADIEDAIEASGLEWTFVRPGAFATNSFQWRPQIEAGDVVRLPYPEAVSAPIHEADIAAVAVQALTSEGHAGARHLLTGPESLTNGDQVRVLGEAIGRPLRAEEIPVDVARQAMLRHVPEQIVDTMLHLQAASVGRPALVTDTVEKVTGRPARTYAQWAADHASDFR
ncbi:NAD(P)H-binding protein [Sphaerisporangium fuscum]|uniref:NAD(P)H-binding protein n=1 Tax=Sphaerisporangium fuscum TaxID=2835868 RepID=UPI001BDCCD79|nr:NAD(P)H-binding protein [Sphaerisporangium fuscum]